MTFDQGQTLADRMRAHAGRDEHLYGELMRAMADDWEHDGPVREICRDWGDAPAGAVVQLRLLAGLFRIVLTGRAPELVTFYPCLGGEGPPAAAWASVRPVLAGHVEELREALLIAPQTNEPGRSTALLLGLFHAVRESGISRVRLLETGASAGLNLLVDVFRFEGRGWEHGPAASPLVLRDPVVGPVHPEVFHIVERSGCDLSPVDASTPEGALRLRSFVWPFHVDRHARLAAALRIAAGHPVTVQPAGAGEWLEKELAAPRPDVLTAVWGSITRMYWPADETVRVEAALADAAARMPIAQINMEYPDLDQATSAQLTVRLGSDDAVTLGTVADHGVPVTLS